MAKSVSFNVAYDARADVLYISARMEPMACGTEDPHGIVWRYGSDGKLIGATIVDFREVWGDNAASLAFEIAARFDIPRRQALNVVEHALESGT
ncbi:MAG TPA: DUF2283 domain-containing protein [Caulobacteraceae bacterium]|jgi:uncharacterized protein YuzE|nr:DUF2283 domain-containing protein [Caulobacteraceae bacterium]